MSPKKGCGFGCLAITVIAFILSIFFLNYASSILALAMFIFPVAALVHYFMRDGEFFENHGGKFWAGIIAVTMILAIPLSLSLEDKTTDNPENSELVDTQNNTETTASNSHSATDTDYEKDGIPKLIGPLCDYAGIFSAEEAAALEKYLLSFEEADIPAQFVVLTLRKLPKGKTESSYAQEVGDAWRLGQEGVDNGLLLLFALEDRAVFLATGYGLEGDLPDGKCGSLCRRAVPDFKKEDYAKGITQIVEGVEAVLNHDRFVAKALATLDEELEDFPGDEKFHDKYGHFTPEHQTRLKELLQQASDNTKHNLYFLYLPQMHSIADYVIADKAWKRLKATDPNAALLFYSLEGTPHGSAVITPDDVTLPSNFHISLKYSIDHNTEEEHYHSVGRMILEFEEAITGKRPKGWWSFNLAYGIFMVILFVMAFGFVGIILLVIGIAIWEAIDDKRHPEKAAARRRARASSYSSSSSSSYSSSHSYHSSGGGSSHYSGGGGRFGGGGGGARW